MPLDPWTRAMLSLALLRQDPGGLGGLWLRARSGPVRDRFLMQYSNIWPQQTRIHPGMSETDLTGGLDLGATLSTGRLVQSAGALGRDRPFTLAMAERCPAGMAARLASHLDRATGPLLALDEAAEPEETLPAALADRLAFFVSLDGLSLKDCRVEPMRCGVPSPVAVSDEMVRIAATTTFALGISSGRAPLLLLRAARAHAGILGRNSIETGDLEIAADLVLSHRAAPAPVEPEDAREQTEPHDTPSDSDGETDGPPPEDTVVEAARAALSQDILQMLAAGRAAVVRSGGAGSGAVRSGNRRGRPLPSRPGRPDGAARIDIVATLRAAAPWQTLRSRSDPTNRRVQVRASDIHLRRYHESSDRLLIFTVDASGSSAFARLAEAKGAVELCLAQAYARRDHVCLLAFRGTGAELLLPPTRSLVQTKRRLAALPGGGGTPLAAGLNGALEVARGARAKGMTPSVIVLTDGRGNIALDGTANRQQAAADAERVGRSLAHLAIPSLVIDTGPRPQAMLRTLADVMNAPYLPLPRADANRLGAAVTGALRD
jgi:magnesium chelatase subunit D